MARPQLATFAGVIGLVAVSVATGSIVTASTRTGQVAPAVTGSNTDAYRTSSAVTALSATGGTKTTVLTLTLPAGSWVVAGNAVALSNYGYGGPIHCALYKSGTRFAQAAVPNIPTGTGPSVAGDLSIVGALKSSGAVNVTLRCWQETDISPPYFNNIDAGASIWAHKATSLSL